MNWDGRRGRPVVTLSQQPMAQARPNRYDIGTRDAEESTSDLTPVASADIAELCTYGEVAEIFAEAIDTPNADTDTRIQRLRNALYQARYDTAEATDADLRQLLFRGSGYIERVLEMAFRRRDVLSEQIARKQREREALDEETDADEIAALTDDIESLRSDRDETWDLATKLQTIASVPEDRYVE